MDNPKQKMGCTESHNPFGWIVFGRGRENEEHLGFPEGSQTG